MQMIHEEGKKEIDPTENAWKPIGLSNNNIMSY